MKIISDNEFEKAITEYCGFINYMVAKYNIRGYEKDDLRQEFMLILYKCLKFYKDGTGVKFITYYTTAIHWWIRRQLIRVEHRYQEINLDIEDFMNEFVSDEDVEKEVFIEYMSNEIIECIKKFKNGEYVIEILTGAASVKDISVRLNVSTAHISQECRRIKDKVKIKLKEDIEEYERLKLSR